MTDKINDNKQQWKVFNDPIHGHMALHPLLIKIIDTPQFQRLRYIKQLGGGYFVYPGASHNRFEHSIGVGYLAGQLLQALRTNQPKLDINEEDILCVQIAGLCHDLGHGPFSHLFDGMFLTKAGKEIKHESISQKMFDHLVECNELEAVMKEHKLTPEDLKFIKDMIDRPKAAQGQDEPWPYKKRSKDKAFLMDIVSNKRNGIDVDKWDYLARDCYHLGIQNNFDYRRLLNFTRVCEVDGQRQICFRDKEVDNLYDMFHARYCLHRRACQHRVTTSIQLMIRDAFLKADGHILKGTGGKITLSTAFEDMKVYTKLTDHVFEEILHSSSDELKDSREILNRIMHRKLYKCLDEMQIEETTEEKILEWKEELTEGLSQWLTSEDFELYDYHMDYGMKEEDPINNTYFYRKDTKEPRENLPSASKIAEDLVPRLLAKRFSEHLIRFYYKKADDGNLESVREVVKEHFKRWRAELQAKEKRHSATPGNKEAGDEKRRKKARTH